MQVPPPMPPATGYPAAPPVNAGGGYNNATLLDPTSPLPQTPTAVTPGTVPGHPQQAQGGQQGGGIPGLPGPIQKLVPQELTNFFGAKPAPPAQGGIPQNLPPQGNVVGMQPQTPQTPTQTPQALPPNGGLPPLAI